jgi:hypothetical protein
LDRFFANVARCFVVRLGGGDGAEGSGTTRGSAVDADALALGVGVTLGASETSWATDALAGSTGTALSAVSAVAGAEDGFSTK